MDLVFNWTDADGEQNDETCTVTLNGQHVITMDHGAHGWDGMVGIRDALVTLAKLTGLNVVIKGDEGI